MKLKIDLHVHSNHSIDSMNDLDVIIDRCIQEKLDGFALTDHDTLDGLEKIRNKEKVLIIPGVEISAKGAHVICLNPIKSIQPGLLISETVDQIHGQGGLAILAHPFSLPRSWLNRKNILNGKFDAIETKNAAQIPFNLMENYNIKLAENLNLPKTAGSDSHIPETVGRTYTIIDSDSIDVFDVIKAIRTGKTETVGKGITFKDRLNKFKRFLSKN